jgi:hypothetical protein
MNNAKQKNQLMDRSNFDWKKYQADRPHDVTAALDNGQCQAD